MRQALRILALGGAVLLAACAHTSYTSASFQQEIRTDLDALGRAVVERDAAAIDRLVAPEYRFSQPDAIVSGKAELLASIQPDKEFRYVEHRVTEIESRLYESTAVSNGRFSVSGRYNGQTIAHGVRFTAVHVRRDGRWQLVALHSTFEPDRK